MSNLEINGMNPHTTRVSVLVDDLERIGKELRVHFGNKQEGTVEYHAGSDPLVIKGGGMKKLGPGRYEYIEQPGWTITDYDKLNSTMYNEFFDKDVYVGQMTKPLVRTIKVPGATGMRIKMSYACSGGSGRPQGYLQGNYLWIGAGLHEDASKVQGEYYPGFIAKNGTDWINLEDHTLTCAGCGQPVFRTDEGDYTVPKPDNSQAWVHPCEDENGQFPILHAGAILPYLEREITGDSFTCAWMVDFTGNAYTEPDESNYIGYYIEVTPYNEFGVMANYTYTIDEIPNEFSIDDMDYMISKLNNYPNAEEVKF